jgi:zinc transport system ATP-binding protein
MTVLNVENLSFSYNQKILLNDVSFELQNGDFVAVVGSNGSGKSTLLKIILGLLPHKHGKIKLFNTDQQKFKDWFKIGFVQQTANQNGDFPISVKELIEISYNKNNSLQKNIAVSKVISELSLESVQKNLITELSGGQRQKVYLASALINSPQMLFLDEPTVGVDQLSEQDFWQILQTLKQENLTTIVMVSHDIGAVSQKVDKVLCVQNKVFMLTNPKQLISKENIDNIYGQIDLNLLIHNH